MRRLTWIVAGVLAAAVLIGSMVWILRLVVNLEASERATRIEAAHEERIRLALWRMDSALATFLAFENAMPVEGPEGPRPQEPPLVAERREIPDPESLTARASTAEPSEPLPSAPPAPSPSSPPPPTREDQQMRNSVEFTQRNWVGSQQLAIEVPAKDLLPKPPPMMRSTGPTGVLRTLTPIWRNSELVLERRVMRDGVQATQVLRLDESVTRAWLLAQVRDLLPAADLEPSLDPDAIDPGRQLAMLPFSLDPGPPPVLAESGPSPARLGVLLALSSILLVALAASAVVFAGLRLARRRSDFAAAVIHELRTPLTTFRLYTDMLAEGVVPEDSRPRYLKTLRQQADRLGHLVENVLAYARLEHSHLELAEPLDLEPWLRQEADRLRERAERVGLRLDLQIEADFDSTRVAADPTSLERILHNLCDNSCKYAADGESVNLRAAVRDGKAVLSWRDYGPGIARADRKRLFRSFQRGHQGDGGRRDAAPIEGIGLGLALSRQLVRRLGGELRLVEVEGAGVEVELELPRFI